MFRFVRVVAITAGFVVATACELGPGIPEGTTPTQDTTDGRPDGSDPDATPGEDDPGDDQDGDGIPDDQDDDPDRPDDPNDDADGICWEEGPCVVCLDPQTGEMREDCDEPGDTDPPEDQCWMDPAGCLTCVLPDGQMLTDCGDGDEVFCFDVGDCVVCIDTTTGEVLEEDCAPPPPGDTCDQMFVECLDRGIDPQRCEQRFRECLGDTDPGNECWTDDRGCTLCVDPRTGDVVAEECGDPDQPPCERVFEECLNSGVDPMQCEQRFQECLGGPDPVHECWTDDRGCTVCVDPATGQVVSETCEPDPLPCERAFEECLNSGMDPMRCERQLEQCLDDTDPVDEQCWTDADGCTTCVRPDGTVTTWCEPPPCDQAFQECLDSGVAPERCEAQLDACLGGPDPDEGPTCESLLDDCLALGLDPAVCEIVYAECRATP